jgi:hypothetical protein
MSGTIVGGHVKGLDKVVVYLDGGLVDTWKSAKSL